MEIYKKIESIGDVKTAALLVFDNQNCDVTNTITEKLYANHLIFHDEDDLLKHLDNTSPDILFIRPGKNQPHDRIFEICSHVRGSSYEGIFILITEPVDQQEVASHIIGAGFDNYILTSDGFDRIQDSIYRAILNRKRKVKYNICFDDSLDEFYTIDANGTIYDINEAATAGTPYSPREVVRRKINIEEVGTLQPFDSTIRPLIIENNIDRVVMHTIEEKASIYQIKTKIQNAPTIGLVATVVKTNITRIIYYNTLDLLVNSITLLSHRDNYTAEHSARVFYYIMYFAYATGVAKDRKSARDLYFAALLHDIGKIGIRDKILLKADRLSTEENVMISHHPEKGYEMLKRYEFLRDSTQLILAHHERVDGKGYPNRTKGGNIPLGASILSVFDGFDAMTTDRPYRLALPFDIAVKEIENNIGSQYHIDVGNQFLSFITPTLVKDVRELSKKPLEVIARELVETILKE